MQLQRKQFADELQKAFKEVTGDFVNKRVCTLLIDVYATALTNILINDDSVNIRGFGTFKVAHRKSKGYPDPTNKGQIIVKPPTVYPTFTAGKELTRLVKERFKNEYEYQKDIQDNA